MECYNCGKQLKEKNLCTACRMDLFCPFCEELTAKPDCKGHDLFMTKENRFLTDKMFTEKPMFDLENKDVPR